MGLQTLNSSLDVGKVLVSARKFGFSI